MTRINCFFGNHARLGLSLAMGLVVLALVWPQRTLGQEPSSKPSSDIASLHRQRIATLQQACDYVHAMYDQGQITADEMFRVDRRLIDAKLDATTAPAERIQLLQRALDTARKQERIAAEHERAGTGPALDALDAKAERLRVEIQLAQESAK